MGYTKYFIVPDYYLLFECKCGACRTTCCGGWGISLSMSEYFRLLGLECSAELRRRLDTAFHLADDRSPEHYALVTPRFDGHCRIQAEDGWCMLQRECGEDVLSAVCRYYPRAPRTSPRNECCTSASCERTLELLFESESPIKFVETTLTFELDEAPPAGVDNAYYTLVRERAFSVLSDRSMPFKTRLEKLGDELHDIENSDEIPFGEKTNEPVPALLLCRGLCELLSHSSVTLAEYLPYCEKYYDFSHPETADTTERLTELFPSLDIYFEKLFINHIFYKGFPNSFADVTKNYLEDEYISLCAAFALTKYLTAAYMKGRRGFDDFVDVVAAVFRIIEHSRFDECAVRYLRRNGGASREKLSELINL